MVFEIGKSKVFHCHALRQPMPFFQGVFAANNVDEMPAGLIACLIRGQHAGTAQGDETLASCALR